MATSFFHRSSSQNKGEEDGGRDESHSLDATKSKVRKGGKGAKASSLKRPPRRGLGVAQLEQLRVQERFNKITEFDSSANGIPPLHCPQLPPVPAVPLVYSPPVAYSIGRLHLDYYLHRFHPMLPEQKFFIGNAAGSVIRSVLGDPCVMDDYRRTAAAVDTRFRVGCPFPEPPSNQITQCLSDQCEFCIRKKRLFGNNISPNLSNGADYFEMDLAAAMAVNLDSGCHQTMVKPTDKMEKEATKEFDIFPLSNLNSSYGGASSPDLDNGDAGNIPSSSSFSAAVPLDLSLKLSL